MTDENGDDQMRAPSIDWKLNANSIGLLAMFAAQAAFAGYVYSEHVSGLSGAWSEIGKLQIEVRRIDDITRASSQAISGLDYRVTTVESMAREAISANRETSAVLGELKSDLRVAKEILVRLEATSNRSPTR
ncbi:hypothetical protein [Mesorhizobium temperatum]|uniref:Uncharacterized protein n=1 Tax=Mesorhizobium temperatum TaxID=241416 RepID=A0A271LHL3_9HYPH|nr:hypothetical protein [Mesorhizobium temperatum]PAQ06786.1 hypothetical protein CIT26_23625 [Mesorhizobium temperatum]